MEKERAPIDSTWIAGFGFAYAGVQLMQILWVSRFYGPDILGFYLLIIGVFAPVISFISAGQRFILLSQATLNKKEFIFHGDLRALFIVLLMIVALAYLQLKKTEDLLIFVILISVAIFRVVDGYLEVEMWSVQHAGFQVDYFFLAVIRVLPIPFGCAVAWILRLDMMGYTIVCTLLILFLESIRRIVVRKNNNHSRTSDNSLKSYRFALFSIATVGSASGIESLAIVLPRFFLAEAGKLQEVALYGLFTQISGLIGIVASARLQFDLSRYAKLSKGGSINLIKFALRGLSSFGVSLLIFWFFINYFLEEAYSYLFGNWLNEHLNLFLFIPIVAGVWYMGGYISNIAAITKGKLSLLYLSIALFFIVLSIQFFGYLNAMISIELAISSLFIGFFLRFIISFSGLMRRSESC